MRRQHVAAMRLTSTLFIVLLVLGIALTAGCSSARNATASPRIRVMTWNIHHGEGLDHKVDVERIARIIGQEKPDVVALQEVDRGVGRSGNIDIITKLADLTEMTYAFGKTIDFQGGEYGNAFLTRFPILEERNVLYPMIQPGEQRGILMLNLQVGTEEVVVANTHLENRTDDTARVASATELVKRIQSLAPRPVIVCGDFNDVPGSRLIAGLSAKLNDSWKVSSQGTGCTFPSDTPRKRIDYIWTSNNTRSDTASAGTVLHPILARVIQTAASDHLPYTVDFELRTER
ncbi:MAG TPA: endonuclease/exonuclease/phosphatase family protein [Bacteroidota bacterium]|nr:endonuclease/exonuclease/phosphatase family protein [Bacteroidota bacterium]